MAQVSNPHKKFQFSVFIFGLNPFMCQKVTTSERSIDQVEHGEGNHKIKTAGQINLGNVTIENLVLSQVNNKAIWTWIKLVQDEITGGGTTPEVYKKAFQIQKLGVDLVTPIGTWTYIGAWPCKINGIELDRMSSDNTIESVEFSVDQEIQV